MKQDELKFISLIAVTVPMGTVFFKNEFDCPQTVCA